MYKSLRAISLTKQKEEEEEVRTNEQTTEKENLFILLNLKS